MSIPYTDTIFIGIIRMLLWVLFIYVLKRLFYRGGRSQNQVKAMGYYWSFYGSIVLILIFILVQLGSFDLLTIIALITVFFILRTLGIGMKNFTQEGWNRKSLAILLGVIDSVENKKPIIDITQKNKKEGRRFGLKTEFLVATYAAIIAVVVRFYLMQFDNYQLSISWFEELSVLRGILEQNWISNKLMVTGEFGLMAFYSLITGISPEMALESFGLFQVFILCFVVFWFTDAMTTSLVTVPLIAALTFALFFNLAPISVSQITHSKQSFMALTFWLPAMVYIMRPWKLYNEKPKMYFISILCIFFAIALIDFFTLFMLIPPFFLTIIPFVRKKYKRYYNQALLAYLTATGLVLGYYFVQSQVQGFDFGLFFRSNLLAVSASTSIGNMIYTYDFIVLAYQIVSMLTCVLMFILYLKKKNKWGAPIMFLLYINVMILISKSGFVYFDIDLFNEISPVLLACSVALLFYVIYYHFSHYFQVKISDWYSAPLIFGLFISTAYFSQRSLIEREENSNTVSKNILEAYELIKANYIPYGYAVVNDNNMLPISKGSHIFISYKDFVDDYTARDSVYFANKEDKEFLDANTEYLVPNSLLVFVYEEFSNEFDAKVDIDPEQTKRVLAQLKSLELKGRNVRVFYRNKGLVIYEIVNNPNAAKIDELL